MINLDYALASFRDYCKEYPSTDRINLKIAHMKRVMNNNILLAKSLNLSEEDIALAGLIGLLHDIGRFEQVRIYDTFIDAISIDHASFSVEQLFQHNLIRRFIKDSSYDDIIRKAIENHNKFSIESGLNERELLHARMIKDADKLDIYVEVITSDPILVFDGTYEETDEISDKVLNAFNNHRLVKNEDRKNKVEDYVRKVALIFDFNFPNSLKVLYDQDLIGRLTRVFKDTFHYTSQKTNDTIDKVYDETMKYIIKKTEGLSNSQSIK